MGDNGTIPTAAGDVAGSKLGRTLMHEHIFVFPWTAGLIHEYPQLWDREAEISGAVGLLGQLKASGIETIVDLTVADLGRDIVAIEEVAAATDLNIVVATGFWHQPHPYLVRMTSEEVASLYIADIETGLRGMHTRAGIIKATTEKEVDELNAKLLEAVSIAHRTTGVPISTHSEAAAQSGALQLDHFEKLGVDLSRVVIGHVGDVWDIDYLTRLMDRGCSVGLDRFGLDHGFSNRVQYLDSADRTRMIVDLCGRGYADRITISHDANCFSDNAPAYARAADLPNWHHRHIPNDIVPALLDAGVTEAQIDQILIDNPRRILAHDGPY